MAEEAGENGAGNVDQNPGGAEQDRLHRVKADEGIAFFEKQKNDPAHQRNTRESGGDVRGQTAGCRSCHWLGWWIGGRRHRRGEVRVGRLRHGFSYTNWRRLCQLRMLSRASSE